MSVSKNILRGKCPSTLKTVGEKCLEGNVYDLCEIYYGL